MTTDVERPVSEETVRRALGEFQIPVDSQQVVLIQQYIRTLLRWNEKLNLTAIRDPLEILHRHFCESMFAAGAIPVDKGRLADIGSGPGFPGIPLKIIRPELELCLVESNIKKGTFLAEVVRELRLMNSRVLISRYEELGEEVAPLDFVCSRAVGEFGPFLEWAGSNRVQAHEVILWIGGRDLEEVQKIRNWEWREPILIPKSLQRYLLVGKNQEMSARRQNQ
ncbi:MAG TPA: 16S rRNA (guanine(527)-N(7))-methyltransferase RsmG [Candidatus Sulfotelmatobacter sp.]|jgi:16S rRNA (guanine527-N7)-methyltransferase|nr:16S rRNA (guanine(527)-N(7))-methyltransferase RsmG [Candidatus Sulfotelmatobacter sp.]